MSSPGPHLSPLNHPRGTHIPTDLGKPCPLGPWEPGTLSFILEEHVGGDSPLTPEAGTHLPERLLGSHHGPDYVGHWAWACT